MIDLRHVRHLLAVASQPTVQSAAETLHLTQPALTKSIARFEEELGAKLFDRRGRRLVLTELGERLVERGDDLLRHVRELEEEIALERNDLEIRALAADPIAVAVRPGHPLERKRAPKPADASAYPLAGASTAPRFERWRAERGRCDRGRPFVPSLICDNYEVLVRLAEGSDAIVFGPRKLLSRYERSGRLKVMSWPLEGPDIQPNLIRSKGRPLSPAAERLAAMFAAHDGQRPRR
jgi:DNA-binding transcriptional LysR family regulator